MQIRILTKHTINHTITFTFLKAFYSQQGVLIIIPAGKTDSAEKLNSFHKRLLESFKMITAGHEIHERCVRD